MGKKVTVSCDMWFFHISTEISYCLTRSPHRKSIPKMKFLRISKTRLDLECSSPAFKNYTICENFKQQEQNRQIISCSWILPLVFFQHWCLLNVGLEHFRSDLVFKQHSLCNNFIFGMLYCYSSCAMIQLGLMQS